MISKAEVIRDLVYAKHQNITLAGDLYRPSDHNRSPLLIAIHGGAWETGAREHFRFLGPWLAERGYASFAISYRLAKPGIAAFPDAVCDAISAMQFVIGKADEFGIDSQRIGMLGASAGAQIAALAALAHQEEFIKRSCHGKAVTAVPLAPKVLIGVYGIYDMLEMWQHANATRPLNNIVEQYLGFSPMKDRRIYFEASPLSYATISNNKIAVLLSCGTEDDIVNRGPQSEAFRIALSQARFFVRSCIVPGAPHFWITDPVDETASYSGFFAARLVRFLQEKL